MVQPAAAGEAIYKQSQPAAAGEAIYKQSQPAVAAEAIYKQSQPRQKRVLTLPTVHRAKDWIYVSLFMALAVLLRAPLVHTGITIDDACTAYVVEATNWADMVERIRTIEMSPPFYFVVLKGVVSIFGLTTQVLAITSLAFSVLSIPLTYLLARNCAAETNNDNGAGDSTTTHNQANFAKNDGGCTGLIAAFFATVTLLSVIYSHEARTYALASFLFTLALLLYVPFFDGRSGSKRQLALFVTCALLTYTHYTAVPYVCIMALTAIIFRKKNKSCSLQAVLPMVAGVAAIAPWYPILKYHGSVGTPWSDSTPISQFPSVLAGNLAATSPLPVVPTYIFLTVVTPALLVLWMALKPSSFKQNAGRLLHNPKLLTLTILLFYSASVFGYITPYIFGYVRYMVPVAVTSWVLLALIVDRIFQAVQNKMPALKTAPRLKRGLILLLALVVIIFSAQTVSTIAAADRSGLRRLAHDIAANRFAKAAFITTPDFVGIILVYYLKHECGIAAKDLPQIIGFAYPQGGILPPKHEGRAACWLNPHLIGDYEGYLEDLQKKGAAQIVLVRDTYSPTSKQMPTNEMSNKLQSMLAAKLVPLGPTETYSGYASTYLVTRYAFPPEEGKH